MPKRIDLPGRFSAAATFGLLLAAALPAQAQSADVRILQHCSASSAVLQTLSGEGCHAITASGPSWIDLPEGQSAVVYPTSDCSGDVDASIDADTNLCGLTFSDGGGTNDNVRSIRILPSEPTLEQRVAELEAALEAQTQRVDDVEEENAADGAALDEAMARIAFLERQVTELRTRVDVLSTDVNAFKLRIDISGATTVLKGSVLVQSSLTASQLQIAGLAGPALSNDGAGCLQLWDKGIGAPKCVYRAWLNSWQPKF